jgi:glycine reductase complex component B subunit alpha and beta
LNVLDHRVTAVREGTRTTLDGGILEFDPEVIRQEVLSDDRIAGVSVSGVNAGDPIRLVHVLDCVMPVCKGDGHPGVFPGSLCPVDTVNSSATHRLQGVLVTALGQISSGDAFLSQEEAIIDLRAGADYSPLSAASHVALTLEFAEVLDNQEREAALRRACAATAELLARAAMDQSGEFPSEPASGGTRFAHIMEVSSFGRLFDTRILGTSALDTLPTLVTGQNLADGWVMNADYHYAGQRNFTCFYQDNPIERAAARAGLDIEIVGSILLPVAGSHEGKERGAAVAANLAQALDAEGAVITAVAAGNAHLDVMFAVRACERRGIRTALVLVEFAGPDGSDPGMVDTVPEADLIISTGNREELVSLPPCERVLGGDSVIDADTNDDSPDPREALTVPLRSIAGSNNELGAWRIAAQAL